MSSPNLFPPPPRPRLTTDDVVKFLVGCKAEGHQVYQKAANVFVLSLGDEAHLLLYAEEGTCAVHAYRLGTCVLQRRAETVAQLERVITEAAGSCSVEWPFRPTFARLSATTPATNLASISGLVGTAEVQAVFDPYLDNQALSVLLNILSFNAGIADDVRLLACEKQAKGVRPRLTRTFVDDWFKERGVANGEARLMLDGEHRRFMLLSGGQSLLLGMSLNSIAKNEAVRLEQDAEDRAFFDGKWATATPL
jgi:hypothetical protein